ncbi:MAG TPA: ankyrin repeat domain-containing protein [Blastocatellia bacterium]|nr:ankyrin repeat domain-containing protein [Blastocatellia bacterium]
MDPIFDAVLGNDKEVARLLRKSPDLSQSRVGQDYLVETIPHWLYVGDTPLHLAAAALRTGAAKLLLESGANANAENRRGATPLHYACDPRPKSGGIWDPAKQGELIELLVQHGAKLEQIDRGGASALHRAVRARSPAAVLQLLKAGARVDVRLGKRGSTPIHLAVQSTGAGGTGGAVSEQLEIIMMLLEHGADPEAKDARGRSALDWATNEQVSSALQKKP